MVELLGTGSASKWQGHTTHGPQQQEPHQKGSWPVHGYAPPPRSTPYCTLHVNGQAGVVRVLQDTSFPGTVGYAILPHPISWSGGMQQKLTREGESPDSISCCSHSDKGSGSWMGAQGVTW